MPPKKYWVIVASRDHALSGAEQGIVQSNHGKLGPLKRMSAGDGVLLYAPKLTYGGNEPCQRFVANAELPDEHIFQADVSPQFKPYRRKATYRKITEVDIKPLIERLEFIKNKKSWGYSFRFGLVEIKEPDYNLILKNMLPSNE